MAPARPIDLFDARAQGHLGTVPTRWGLGRRARGRGFARISGPAAGLRWLHRRRRRGHGATRSPSPHATCCCAHVGVAAPHRRRPDGPILGHERRPDDHGPQRAPRRRPTGGGHRFGAARRLDVRTVPGTPPPAFRGRRGHRALVDALDGPVAHSHLERRFLALVRRAGIPLPRTQVTYRFERVVRVDAVWEDERVVAEVMGHRFHCTALDLQRDAHRRNELQEAGFEVLEFPTVDIAHRPVAVTGRLARVLANRRDAFRH
jgi:very-short-patch-repair endonuclease